MKPRLFSFGILLFSALPLFAEPGAHPPGPPSTEGRLEHLKKDLNLSASQVATLKPIVLATEQKMKALHSESSLSEEQRREKAQGIRRAGGEAIRAELSPEQATLFDAEVQKRHQKGPPGGGPGAKGGPKGN